MSRVREGWWGSGWVKALLLIGVFASAWWGVAAAGIDLRQLTPQHLRSVIETFGGWAPGVYVVLYGQPLVPLPTSILAIAGGLIFGPLRGVGLVLAGATTRACTQYGMARWLGRPGVERFLRGRLASLDRRISERPFLSVLLIRLIPNVPYDLQNYGLGFSRVGFGPYLLATALGIIPNCIAFVSVGHTLFNPRQAAPALGVVLLVLGLAWGVRLWIGSRANRQP